MSADRRRWSAALHVGLTMMSNDDDDLWGPKHHEWPRIPPWTDLRLLYRNPHPRPPRDMAQWAAWANGQATTGPRWMRERDVETIARVESARSRRVPDPVPPRREPSAGRKGAVVAGQVPPMRDLPPADPPPFHRSRYSRKLAYTKKRKEAWAGWEEMTSGENGWYRGRASIRAAQFREEYGWNARVGPGPAVWFALARDARRWCEIRLNIANSPADP